MNKCYHCGWDKGRHHSDCIVGMWVDHGEVEVFVELSNDPLYRQWVDSTLELIESGVDISEDMFRYSERFVRGTPQDLKARFPEELSNITSRVQYAEELVEFCTEYYSGSEEP